MEHKTKRQHEKAKQKAKRKERAYGDYPDISSTVSACECTGLMSSPPQNEAEFEAYQALSGMQIPEKQDKA